MEFYEHFLASVIAAPIITQFLFGSAVANLSLVIYGILAGVLIDLDHFLLARRNRGSWKHLVFAVKNPLTTLSNGENVFGKTVSGEERLLTHSLVLLASTTLLIVSLKLFLLTASMLSLHIVCDVYSTYLG